MFKFKSVPKKKNESFIFILMGNNLFLIIYFEVTKHKSNL